MTDEESAQRAASGAAVVDHCAAPAYTEWSTQMEPMLRGVLHAAQANEAVLVNSSNAYMYDPSAAPMTETSPERPRSTTGEIRARLGAEVRDASITTATTRSSAPVGSPRTLCRWLARWSGSRRRPAPAVTRDD